MEFLYIKLYFKQIRITFPLTSSEGVKEKDKDEKDCIDAADGDRKVIHFIF